MFYKQWMFKQASRSFIMPPLMSDSIYIHMKIGIQYSCKALGEFLRGLHTCDPFLEV